jgi:hypothetical protein
MSTRRKTVPKILKNQVWDKICGRDKGIGECYCCKKEIDSKNFDAGHIKSVKNGGTTTIDNLVPLCSICNKSIGSENVEEFIITYIKPKETNIDTKTPPEILKKSKFIKKFNLEYITSAMELFLKSKRWSFVSPYILSINQFYDILTYYEIKPKFNKDDWSCENFDNFILQLTENKIIFQKEIIKLTKSNNQYYDSNFSIPKYTFLKNEVHFDLNSMNKKFYFD